MPSRSMFFGKLLLSVITFAVLCSSVSSGEVYVPKVLFSMKYGNGVLQLPKGKSEVDAWDLASSVDKFLVPSENRIIIGKGGDARVIVLNSRGKLQSVIRPGVSTNRTKEQVLTEFGDRRITGIAAAPYGNILISVPDREHSIRVYSADGKFNKQGWNTIYSQIVKKVKLPRSALEWTAGRADAVGNYYISVFPDKTNTSAIAKFDAKLKFLGFMPGRGGIAGWNGFTYKTVRNPATAKFSELWMYNGKGKAIGNIKLVPPAAISEGDYDSKTGGWNYASLIVDKAGNFYVIVNRRRAKNKWTNLDRHFNIVSDVAIYKFNPKGEFNTKLVVKGLPCPLHPEVAVDPAGNIYHLAYYKDRIDMVKYSPRK